MTPLQPSFGDRVFAWMPFVASAALVAYGLRLALDEPILGLALALLAALLVAPNLRHRQHLRRLLRSGNVEAVLAAWDKSLDQIPHRQTMEPLIRATALAAHGFADRARSTLARAHRGPAWDAALEQRLVLETLLDSLDGERERAMDTAAALGRLPLPPSPLLRGRVQDLRSAMGAFARAFAHRTQSGDARALEAAARSNPLVHWAMRYAAAVAHIDRGQGSTAARLVAGAPDWPDDSVFHAFHAEITEYAKPKIE